MKIGNVKLANPYILAPMAGVTDRPVPAALQGAGSGTFVYGDDQCEGTAI